MAIIKPVKKFSRESPCTKVHLHNCFAGPHGYVARPVVEAQGEVGENSVKYLLKKGYAVYRSHNNIDYYELTAEGTVWLFDGLAAHLKRHPDDEKKVVTYPVTARKGSKLRMTGKPVADNFTDPTDLPSETVSENKLRVARTKLKEQ